MHESGLHYFDPRDQEFTFFNTVPNNKEGFIARKSKRVEVARALYAPFIYLSAKDFKSMILSNQINNCPVIVQDVEVTQKVWGTNIAALKS